DEALARRIGNAFARFAAAPTMLVGRDMRASSEPLAAAFAEGAIKAGTDVVELGLCSTDVVYFASGRFDAPGAMFTASHNPAQYNGVKLCRRGAAPVGQDTGLAEVRAGAEALLAGVAPPPAGRTGSVRVLDVLPEYAAY